MAHNDIVDDRVVCLESLDPPREFKSFLMFVSYTNTIEVNECWGLVDRLQGC